MRNLIKKFFVVLIVIFAAQTGHAELGDDWFMGRPIRDITFSGLRHIRAAELEGLMLPFRGRLFDETLYLEIIGRLFALEYFDSIMPEEFTPTDAAGSEVIVRLAVAERPVVNRINFIGHSHLRRSELLDTVSLRINDMLNQARLHTDEQAIINRYIERGFPDVSVRAESQSIGEGIVQINFFITEGARITIGEIRFEGNTVFSARTLRGQLSLRPRGVIHDGAFQEAVLVADRVAIAQFYHDRGYIDAEVVDVTREIVPDERGNNNLILTFVVYEGIRFTFGGVEFVGNQIFSTEQLSALIRSRVGETINARRVEADLQRVAELYFENGYIFNHIGRTEHRDRETGVISYTLTIVERGRAHIENIIIRGNVRTRTDVILREIPLEPGDVFSRTRVMEAWRNLMNLQFFSMVIPEPTPGSVDNLVDLVFVVEEMPTTDLQAGATFAGSAEPGAFPVSFLLQWNDRNFRGSGNQLGADINVSFRNQSGSVTYNHRNILGLPLMGGFDFTVQRSERQALMNNRAPFFHGDEPYAFPDGFISREEFINSNQRPADEFLMNFEQWFLSLGFSTGYRWVTPAGLVSLGGGIRTGLIRNGFDENIFRPFDPALRDRNNQFTPRNSIWTSFALDRRDLFFDPSSGYYFFQRFSFHGLLPGERERFIRSDSRVQFFVPLFDIPVSENWNFRAVLALNSGLSFIFPQDFWNFNSMPIVEDGNKLAVDGMFVGRGWSDEFGRKGLLLLDNWAEIRVPLVPGLLALDFFFDAAAVESRQGHYFSGFTIENMRFGFGAGLRFTMPQFPFRLSLAKLFRVIDGEVVWEDNPNHWFRGDGIGGWRPVLSFAISY